MDFKTPCFVRVEDAQKRQSLLQWLCSIGYHVCICTSFNGWPNIHCSTIECNDIRRAEVHGIPDDDTESGYNIGIFKYENAGSEKPAIDCGTDIDLFKALAAMNDDNDRDQVFTDDKGHFATVRTEKADITSWEIYYHTSLRKATTEEIIKYFDKLKSSNDKNGRNR